MLILDLLSTSATPYSSVSCADALWTCKGLSPSNVGLKDRLILFPETDQWWG